MLMLLLVITLLILTIVRLVLAIQLTVAARRKDMPNLLWLAIYFYATFFLDIFLNLNANTNLTVNVGGLTVAIFITLSSLAYLVGDIAMVSFIHLTFYRNRKSPYLFFLGASFAFFIGGIVVACTLRSAVLFNFFIWGWLVSAAYKGYRQVASDKSVEDWVKARYQLVLAYAIVLLLAALSTIPSVLGSRISALLAIVAVIPTVILQYLVWAMPEGFRRFLNRKYQPPTQTIQAFAAMPEEEILRQLQEGK